MSTANRITTPELVRAFTTVPDDVTTPILQLQIDRACQALADYCNRTFGSTTYRTWLDGTGTSRLYLSNWPITQLKGFGSCFQTVLEIQQTGKEFASVTFDGTTLTLWSIASGVETTTSLVAATYPTVATMAAAISLVSGWTASTVSGRETQPTVMIRYIESVPVGENETVPLEAVDDLIRVRLDIENGRELHIPRSYQSQYVFPCGHNNIFVWYVAGYTLPTGLSLGTTPEPLVYAANMMCKVYIDSAKESFGTMMSEKTGDYSYSKGASMSSAYAITSNMIESLGQDLTPYRRFL